MSESINLGHVNISTDITINGKVREIKIDLTPISKRLFTKNIKEKNTKNKFNNKKENCHSLPKITLQNAISKTGTEEKNSDGLWDALSIKKNSYKLKSRFIKLSAHFEYLSESEDMEKPDLKM